MLSENRVALPMSETRAVVDALRTLADADRVRNFPPLLGGFESQISIFEAQLLPLFLRQATVFQGAVDGVMRDGERLFF